MAGALLLVQLVVNSLYGMERLSILKLFYKYDNINQGWEAGVRAGAPETHDLAGAILFFLQEPEHFKKL